MKLNIHILNPDIPSVSTNDVVSHNLQFKVNGTEGDITFKVKIIDTELQIFILNDKDEELKEVGAKLRVGKKSKTYSIPLRFKLNEKPVEPSDVDLILTGTNDSGTTAKGVRISIICQ